MEENDRGSFFSGIEERRFLLLLMGASLFWRLPGIQSHSLSVDEAGTWLTAGQPLSQILPYMARTCEVHPPLYFYLMHLWMKLGTAECILRASSLIFGLLTIYLSYLMARKHINRNAASWAAIFLTFSSFHAILSCEYRMYPLLTSCYLLSFLMFFRWLEKGQHGPLILATGITITGLYIHYLAVFIPVIQCLFFLLCFRQHRKLLPGLLIAQAVTIAAFLPWLFYYLSHSGSQDFTLRFAPGLADVASLMSQLFLGPALAPYPLHPGAMMVDICIPAGFVVLLIIVFSMKYLSREAKIFYGLYFFLPLLVITLVSKYTHIRIFEYKYFFIVAPAFFIILGALADRIQRMKPIYLLLAFYLLFNSISWAHNAWDPRFGPQNWRLATQLLMNNVEPGDAVVIHPSMMGGGLYYYCRIPINIIPVDEIEEKTLEEKLGHSGKIWLCTVPFHPYVQRTGLEKWFDLHYRYTGDYAIMPEESFIPSNVIEIKAYEKGGHEKTEKDSLRHKEGN